MGGALGDPGAEHRDGNTLRREEPFDRRTLGGKRDRQIGDERRDADLAADHGIGHRGLAWKQRGFERRLPGPIVLAQHLAFEHRPSEGAATSCHDGLSEVVLAEFWLHQVGP